MTCLKKELRLILSQYKTRPRPSASSKLTILDDVVLWNKQGY